MNEELSSPLAKEKWRKLVKRYHPDASKADNKIIRKINNAKDKGDANLLSLYKELTDKKIKKPEPSKKPESYDISALRKYQQKRRKKAKLKDLKMPERF